MVIPLFKRKCMDVRHHMLDIALSQYGQIEVAGATDNPEVMKYFHETGRDWVDSDSTPWCDAFMDWVIMKAGGTPTPGLLARAWMDAGEEEADPKPGHIVVLWRVSKDSIYGHVGLFVRKDEDHVWILGGNQSDMVRISPYPIERVLGYRKILI